MMGSVSRFLASLFGLTREERLAVSLVLALALLVLGALAWQRHRQSPAFASDPGLAAPHFGNARDNRAGKQDAD